MKRVLPKTSPQRLTGRLARIYNFVARQAFQRRVVEADGD
jgi:hypothetical protein